MCSELRSWCFPRTCFHWILQDVFNCSQQTWKTAPKTVKLLPTQCPNVVSGGETRFMELPHIFLMKCTRHRSCYLHGVVFMFGTERLLFFARNIPKMDIFFCVVGQIFILSFVLGFFRPYLILTVNILRRTGLGGWWLQGGNCSCNGRGRDVMVRKSCVILAGFFGHDLLAATPMW